MTLKQLLLYNFGPYRAADGQPQKLTFPDDPQRRVMAVFGDNERGKTSLINALRWVLYDRALDRQAEDIGVHNLLNRLALREGDREVYVALQFEHDGDLYDLRRKAKVKDLVDHPRGPGDFDRTVLLQKNGEVVQADRIEKTLNDFIPEGISRFYLFDGELLGEYEMLLRESSDKSREIRQAVERILGVPALTNGRDELKKLLRDAQRVQAKDQKRDDATKGHATQSLQLQDEIEGLETEIRTLHETSRDYQREADKIKTELANSEEARSAQAKLDLLRERVKAISKSDDNLKLEQADALTGAWRDLLQPLVQSRRDEILGSLDQIRKRTRHVGATEERIKIVQEVLSDECPFCGTTPGEDRRAALGDEIGRLKTELEIARQDADRTADLGGELDRLNKIQRTGAPERLRQIKTELDRNDVEMIGIDTQIAKIENALRSHDVAYIAELQRKQEGLTSLRGRLEMQIDTKQSTLDDRQAKLERLGRLMSSSPSARAQSSSRMVEVYDQLANVFEQSVDHLRDRLRGLVETNASEAFMSLTNEPSYTGLQINDQYGLSILDEDGKPFPIRSAGAEQVVAMSLLSALNRTADRPGPVVVDTPFGRLDPHHRQNILAFLPTMANQVVLLVHEGEVAKAGGLDPVADLVGAVYEIQRVTSDHSRLVRTTDHA